MTIDFEGKIDGEPFAGGKAEAFQFIIGEGQMLEQFDKAVRGMKVGESKTFPLQFPADYHGKDVAGKEADFLVTHEEDRGRRTCPTVDEAFAKSLGIEDGSVEGLRADVKKNLEREVQVPRAGAQQGGGDGRAGRLRRSWTCPRRWWATNSSA